MTARVTKLDQFAGPLRFGPVGGRARTGIATAAVLLGACSSGHLAITTTTTPGPVARHAPFLQIIDAEGSAPCAAGTVPGFGKGLDGACFQLGTTIATTSDVDNYLVSCTDPARGWTISFTLSRDDGAIGAWNKAHSGNPNVALVEDGVVVVASPFFGPLTRTFEISSGGGRSDFHASALRRIGARSGARTHGPTPMLVAGSSIVTFVRSSTSAPVGRCKTNGD